MNVALVDGWFAALYQKSVIILEATEICTWTSMNWQNSQTCKVEKLLCQRYFFFTNLMEKVFL